MDDEASDSEANDVPVDESQPSGDRPVRDEGRNPATSSDEGAVGAGTANDDVNEREGEDRREGEDGRKSEDGGVAEDEPASDPWADDWAGLSGDRVSEEGSRKADPADKPIDWRETADTGWTPPDEETIHEYTTDRRSLTPAVQIQWGVWMTVNVVILTLILTAVINWLALDPRFGTLILVGLFVLGMAWVGARYKRWVYQVRAEALYLERGVVTHVRTLVPYVRIQHVDTSRGPLERALGLSTLVVYTAGSRGADVSIPGLTPEEASDLQQRVKELAIEAEGDDAL